MRTSLLGSGQRSQDGWEGLLVVQKGRYRPVTSIEERVLDAAILGQVQTELGVR